MKKKTFAHIYAQDGWMTIASTENKNLTYSDMEETFIEESAPPQKIQPRLQRKALELLILPILNIETLTILMK